MQKVEFIDRHSGIATNSGNVLTFEVQGVLERDDIRQSEYQSLYGKYLSDKATMRVGNYVVPIWGDGHNLYPQEVYSTTSENKLLPEVIMKQVKFLFGKGPRLYQEKIGGEGDNAKRVRVPVENAAVDEWLESWEDNGFAPVWEYLKNRIIDFYYVNTCCSQWHYTKARQSRSSKMMKVQALTYVGADEARLATNIKSDRQRIKNADCRYVIVADWMNPQYFESKVYHRFDPSEPTKFPTAISFDADKSFSKWIYAQNNWYKGLFEWIKASNLSPKYLNSYLKNALNAHIHVVIPGSWYNSQKEILQNICNENLIGDSPVQESYHGVQLADGKKVIPFYESMMDELISHELRQITSLMSGEGKNQGKLWASTKWGDDGWQFEEFPGKFKEFFDTVISYDKRADQVTLAGKGVPPSISGIDGEGSISNSGSEVYYNYLIYLSSLVWDEYFVMRDLNRALHLNFPELKAQHIKFGFWIDIPAKLQETTPSARPAQTATADTKDDLKKTDLQEGDKQGEEPTDD